VRTNGEKVFYSKKILLIKACWSSVFQSVLPPLKSLQAFRLMRRRRLSFKEGGGVFLFVTQRPVSQQIKTFWDSRWGWAGLSGHTRQVVLTVGRTIFVRVRSEKAFALLEDGVKGVRKTLIPILFWWSGSVPSFSSRGWVSRLGRLSGIEPGHKPSALS